MATELSTVKRGSIEEFMEEWTSNGTMTIPEGCRVIHVTAVGAGGAGSGGLNGEGGQSGVIVFDKPYIVQELDVVNVTVGAGNSVVSLGGSTIVRAAAGGTGTVIERVVDPWAVQLSGGLAGAAGESSSSGTGGAGSGGGGGAAGLEGNGGAGGAGAGGGNGTGYGSGGGGQGTAGGAGTGAPGIVRIRYLAYQKAQTT